MKGNEEKIEQLLLRNVESVIDKKHLREALLAAKKLRVKLGIDPTSPDLHLGHAVVLEKLKEFQDLGCTAVLVIGDFTGQIGDPSGRDKTRPPLSVSEIRTNLKNYLRQAGKIIDIKKAEIVYNNDWLGKLDGKKMLELLSLVTVQQIIEREDFQKRIADHAPIRMHELLYPLMQAYDSITIKADVELGGTDQTFNLLMGRTLMEKFGMKPQDVMTSPLLEGTDGKKKMSKSLGNYIGLEDVPEDLFGKIMSVRDELVMKYFLLCTTLSEQEIKKMQKELGPKELKERLGFEIVKRYHGLKTAQNAQENFEKLFSKREIPTDLPELRLKKGNINPVDVVIASGAVKSRGEARRLVEQGGFDIDGKTDKNPQSELILRGGEVIKVGKKRFFKAKIS